MNGDFIIHLEDYADAILGLPAESAGKLFLSLVTYAKGEEVGHLLDDDLLARTTFSIMKSHIDRDRAYKEKMSAIGKKGGAPVGNSNASKTTKNNQKQAEVDLGCFQNNQKQRPNPKPNPKLNPFIREILSCLNENTGKHFKESKETVRLITARLEEGYTVEDFKVVITKKCKEWKNDPKMSTFLRPSTLFAPSHFDEYLNQTEAKEKIVECSKGFSMINRDESEIDFSALEKRLVKNY